MNLHLSTFSKVILLFLLGSAISMNSCKKDVADTEPAPKVSADVNSSNDNSVAENMFADVFKVTDDALKSDSATGKRSYTSINGGCPTVTIVPAWPDTTFPKTITIDFATGCTSTVDGRYRSGSIIVTLNAKYKDNGTIVNVTPDNYYVNGYKVEGHKTITNNGYNIDSNLTFTVEVDSAKITTPSGDIITWQSSRTNEWIAGQSTSFFTHGIAGICDDVYLITGSANGINRNGLAFTVDITSALRKEICCKHIVSGTLDITPSGLATRTIDYGNGACDGNVSITVNGVTYYFTMP